MPITKDPIKSWRPRFGRRFVTIPAALITVLGVVFMSTVVAAEPASAAMNQAATAFYDKTSVFWHQIPLYNGTFTIQPRGTGTHITTLHWQNTNVSNVCAQKVDFIAYDGQNRQVWPSYGAGVFAPPCRHDFTANRAVNLSSAGVVKICGTLYFARATTGPNPDWYPKVTSCAIM